MGLCRIAGQVPGQRAWLRVSPFLEHEMSRKAWQGTAEAAAIPGVSKPALLHRIEWHADGPEPVPVSAEILTLVTDPLASRDRFPRTAPDLPEDWFHDLSASLAALRAYPTDRRSRFTMPRSTATCSARPTAGRSRLAAFRPSGPSTST